MEELFRKFKAENDPSKQEEIVKQVCTELIIPTRPEEEIYPACRKRRDRRCLDEGQAEHDSAKILIGELLTGSSDDETMPS